MSAKKTISAQETSKEDYGDIREFMFTLFLAVFIALLVRSVAFEPFNIPSGSMLPTLQIGDYIFVSKYSYGYSRYSFPFGIVGFKGRVAFTPPERGDVAVFKQPKRPQIDYIKRLVGLPGERIQVISGVLHINGAPVLRERVGTVQQQDENGNLTLYVDYIETLPNGVKHHIHERSDTEPYDDTPEYTVPEGHYFAMGDNRDSSQDSRVMERVGFIPADNLVGRAEFVFFSTDGSAPLSKPWTWFSAIRYGRLFNGIH